MDSYSHITNKMRIEMVDIMENFTNKKATGDNPVATPWKYDIFFSVLSSRPLATSYFLPHPFSERP